MGGWDDRLAQLEVHLQDLRASMETSGNVVDSTHLVLADVVDAVIMLRREQEALQRALGLVLVANSQDRRFRSFDLHNDKINVGVGVPVPLQARFVFEKTADGALMYVEIPNPDEATTWDKIKSG